MIVYQIEKQFFPLKGDAETKRKQLGLKTGATIKHVITNREELAELLNTVQWSGTPEPFSPAGTTLADLGDAPRKNDYWRSHHDEPNDPPEGAPQFLVDTVNKRR